MTTTEQGAAGRRTSVARDLLYEAAATLFVEHGFEDTTMADIAERAGTARRTAFNHFPSKGDIPTLWARRMADRAVEAITASSDDDAPERIRRYFRLISRMVEAEPELARQMMLGWTAAIGPIRCESQFLVDLTPLLGEGQEHGQVGLSVDVAEAARTLADVYLGVIFRWIREPDPSMTLQAVADSAIGLVLSAIQPHA